MISFKKIFAGIVVGSLMLQFFLLAPRVVYATNNVSVKSEHSDCLREWRPFETFHMNELIVHNGQVFIALQPVFTDFGDPAWAPGGVAHSLWRFVGYIEDFCQCEDYDYNDDAGDDNDENHENDYDNKDEPDDIKTPEYEKDDNSSTSDCLREWRPFETFHMNELVVHNGRVFIALQPVFTDFGDPAWAPGGAAHSLWQFVGYIEDFCHCKDEDYNDDSDDDDENHEDDKNEYIPCDNKNNNQYTPKIPDDNSKHPEDNYNNNQNDIDPDSNDNNYENNDSDNNPNLEDNDFPDTYYYTSYIENFYSPIIIDPIEWNIPDDDAAPSEIDVLRLTVAEEVREFIELIDEILFSGNTALPGNISQVAGITTVLVAHVSLVITAITTVLVVVKMET